MKTRLIPEVEPHLIPEKTGHPSSHYPHTGRSVEILKRLSNLLSPVNIKIHLNLDGIR